MVSRRNASWWLAGIGLMLVMATTQSGVRAEQETSGAVIVMETSKGTLEFETYPAEAPRTVEQIVGLVNKGSTTVSAFTASCRTSWSSGAIPSRGT